MHIDFALPVGHDLLAGWEEWQRKAADAVMDYGFHMAVTSWSDRVAADMGALAAKGVNSFKFFMAYKGGHEAAHWGRVGSCCERVCLPRLKSACSEKHRLEGECPCLLHPPRLLQAR
jgi:dihydroorotase-like cyclic amidohydrolase